MHKLSVSGYVGFQKPKRDGLKVCYLTQNLSQFHLACLSCIGSQNNYVVFNPERYFELHVLGETFDFDPSNTQFCFEINTLRVIISSFDIIITTVGHLSPVMNKDLQAIIDLAILKSIPIIDVPHGLFQFGHNFWDDSKIINLASCNYGAGGWVDSFCNSQINWFRESPNGPGYPRYNKNLNLKQFCVPEFTLLTTNSNWYLYDSLWQRSLLKFITNYAFENPEELMLWAPHPSELANCASIRFFVDRILPPNVFIYGDLSGIKFNGVECTEDLIACCAKGITTVSTCLVDYELNNKDVVVLSSDSTERLVKSLKSVSAINLPSQLKQSVGFSKLETGYLHPYDVTRFDQLIQASVLNN